MDEIKTEDKSCNNCGSENCPDCKVSAEKNCCSDKQKCSGKECCNGSDCSNKDACKCESK